MGVVRLKMDNKHGPGGIGWRDRWRNTPYVLCNNVVVLVLTDDDLEE